MWREYEKQIHREFCNKHPNLVIEYDRYIQGRYSLVERQIDILITGTVADVPIIGAFDCKCFSDKVDVKVVDSMVGFADDVNVTFGGIVTTIGFSEAASNRARASKINLRVVKFLSPEQLVDDFIPSLDFSDARNSMYIPLL